MFTRDALMPLLNARPFAPFRFFMDNGDTVDVPSRDMILPLKDLAVVASIRPGHSVADGWMSVWYGYVLRTELIQPGLSLAM